MSEKITVEYQNVREKAREMSDNAKELWDKWEKHKRGYFLVTHFQTCFLNVGDSDVGDGFRMLIVNDELFLILVTNTAKFVTEVIRKTS